MLLLVVCVFVVYCSSCVCVMLASGCCFGCWLLSVVRYASLCVVGLCLSLVACCLGFVVWGLTFVVVSDLLCVVCCVLCAGLLYVCGLYVVWWLFAMVCRVPFVDCYVWLCVFVVGCWLLVGAVSCCCCIVGYCELAVNVCCSYSLVLVRWLLVVVGIVWLAVVRCWTLVVVCC